MGEVFTFVLIGLLYVIPFVVAWAVIYSAVLAALRRHDEDIAQSR